MLTELFITEAKGKTGYRSLSLPVACSESKSRTVSDRPTISTAETRTENFVLVLKWIVKKQKLIFTYCSTVFSHYCWILMT